MACYLAFQGKREYPFQKREASNMCNDVTRSAPLFFSNFCAVSLSLNFIVPFPDSFQPILQWRLANGQSDLKCSVALHKMELIFDSISTFSEPVRAICKWHCFPILLIHFRPWAMTLLQRGQDSYSDFTKTSDRRSIRYPVCCLQLCSGPIMPPIYARPQSPKIKA